MQKSYAYRPMLQQNQLLQSGNSMRVASVIILLAMWVCRWAGFRLGISWGEKELEFLKMRIKYIWERWPVVRSMAKVSYVILRGGSVPRWKDILRIVLHEREKWFRLLIICQWQSLYWGIQSKQKTWERIFLLVQFVRAGLHQGIPIQDRTISWWLVGRTPWWIWITSKS